MGMVLNGGVSLWSKDQEENQFRRKFPAAGKSGVFEPQPYTFEAFFNSFLGKCNDWIGFPCFISI